MLYFIGLGLADERDITVAGLEIVRRAERVYLESYTSLLLVPQTTLETFYNRPIILADRELVESASTTILADAATTDIAFLVVGDPFGATTHTDLLLRAREQNIPTRTIHNASIMNAIGACGLQLYNFGQTVSMVFFTDNWRPESWYEKVKQNADIGLHTLVLLDIKVKEQDWDAIARGAKGAKQYKPPRFMTVAECASQMVEVAERRKKEEGEETCYDGDSLAVGVARLGSKEQKIVAGRLSELVDVDMGKPLHSLVLMGKRVHELEIDFVREFAVDKESFDESVKKGGYGTTA
ncbi:Diphthine synthase [Ascodesmis nigricans]|uniref:Diphthine methyl ester synthase n=1 Tax=Ascodesmis nigricans TaxID=341454 RepID=A0A4S2N745_9PEZI|nr:Diphthine synthase [Ascodesmis nigricans]